MNIFIYNNSRVFLVIKNGMRVILIFCLLSASVYAETNALTISLWGNAAAYAGVDVNTLYGIALQETGIQWSDGTFRPWPWSLCVNKSQNGILKGAYRFNTKQDAQRALINMLDKGVNNVDVGLMQINVMWNGHRVKDKASLLEPSVNLTVAASILKDVNNSQQAYDAVGKYHSFNTERGLAYANRVKHYQRMLHEKYH